MARVLVLRDESLGRLIVAKLFEPSLASELSAERFAREIRLAATLQHPQIVPLLRAGDLDGVPWYTMPFVDGASLRERLRERGRLPWREALPILRDVARALAYAHARDVVHRDIKPENVLLTSDSAVVADFGVAKAIDRSRTQGDGRASATRAGVTGIGMVVGTPAYMAPEQAAGDPDTGGAADVYAWGLLAYEMLTGSAPFTASTPHEYLAAHLAKTPAPLQSRVTDVPAELAEFVMSCLAKAPADRPTATGLVQRCEQSVLTPTEGVRGDAQSARRSRSWRRILSSAAVLAVTGIGGAWLWARNATAQAAETAVKERVYFAPFVNRTGDASLNGVGEIAADYLARGLIESGLADAVGAFGQETTTDARSVRGVFRRGLGGERSEAVNLGAGTLVEGAVYRVGDSLRYEARVIDARDGTLLRSIDPVRASLTAPDVALGVVADRVLGAIGLYLDPDVRLIAGQTRRPPTFDAYRAFMTGVRIPGWDSTAHYHLLAARLDTTFDYSLVRVARARYNGDRCGGVDSVAIVLAPRRVRMTRFEIASLDLYVALCASDKNGALNAAHRMEQIAPRSDFVQMEVIRAAAAAGAHEEALRRTEKLDGGKGWFAATDGAPSLLFESVLPAYIALDRLPDLQRRAERWPQTTISMRIQTLRTLITVAILQGDCAGLVRHTASFLALPEGEQSALFGAQGWVIAGSAALAGCSKEGQAWAEEAIRLAPSIERLAPTALGKAQVRLSAANSASLLGRLDEARATLAQLETLYLKRPDASTSHYAMTMMVHAAAMAKDTARVAAWRARYYQLPTDRSALNRAAALVFIENAVGHTDAAAAAMLEAFREEGQWVGRLDAFLPLKLEMRYMPGLDAVRADPRVAQALGLRPSDAGTSRSITPR